MSAAPALPMYLDAMLDAWQAGWASRAIHFGYWPSPPSRQALLEPGAFARAQARLDGLLLELARVDPGCRVLDVGCGLGGTLEALNRLASPLSMTGVNIDARQLAACRTLLPCAGSTMAWVVGDACALPFAAAAFDRVLCVEAIFHFRSRAAFLAEAARVLAPGGSLVLTDLLARRAGASRSGPYDDTQLALEVARAFGPWPEFWVDEGDATPAGGAWLLSDRLDLTPHTLPTHAFTARADPPPDDLLGRACQALAWLHGEGRLHVVAKRYVRRGR